MGLTDGERDVLREIEADARAIGEADEEYCDEGADFAREREARMWDERTAAEEEAAAEAERAAIRAWLIAYGPAADADERIAAEGCEDILYDRLTEEDEIYPSWYGNGDPEEPPPPTPRDELTDDDDIPW